MKIAKNIIELKNSLSETVTLIAVSKTKPQSDLIEAYKAGQRDFGENKIQEMSEKWEHLPKDIHWHMIGHVQTNKVKYMAPYVALIHGVDRPKLLKEINKQAKKNKRKIPCLLQIHIAQEDSKFGFSTEECKQAIQMATNLSCVQIKGLMGMATFTEDQKQISEEFAGLKTLFDQLIEQNTSLEILSMGMSGDFSLAISQGSNMIRVGSRIFGPRNY